MKVLGKISTICTIANSSINCVVLKICCFLILHPPLFDVVLSQYLTGSYVHGMHTLVILNFKGNHQYILWDSLYLIVIIHTLIHNKGQMKCTTKFSLIAILIAWRTSTISCMWICYNGCIFFPSLPPKNSVEILNWIFNPILIINMIQVHW